MAASPPQKSRGAGTIIVVLLLFLAVAGTSAFFIHNMLTGENPLLSLLGSSERAAPGGTEPSANGTAQGESGQAAPPAVLKPGEMTGEPGMGGTPETSHTPVPAGQFVVPPANVPDVFADSATSDSLRDGLPPSYDDDDPDQLAPEWNSGPSGPAPNLLLVPGAIATPPAAAHEDAVVRPAFVDDIAAFLVQNYWPKNTHPSARQRGITTASLQWANLRYGADLRGLDGGGDPRSARRAILGYVLNPSAVSRIYALYAEGFVAALHVEANKRMVGEEDGKRPLTEQEKKEMFSIYADYAALVAVALGNYAADAAMPKRVAAYAEAEKSAQEANRVYMESALAFEGAMEDGDKANITATRLRMDKEAATYQKRIREREAARNTLVTAMRGGKNGGGDDIFLYTAFWAYRRGENSAEALRASGKALSDMSAKLKAAAR